MTRALPKIIATNFVRKFKKFCKGVQGKKLFQKFFSCKILKIYRKCSNAATAEIIILPKENELQTFSSG